MGRGSPTHCRPFWGLFNFGEGQRTPGRMARTGAAFLSGQAAGGRCSSSAFCPRFWGLPWSGSGCPALRPCCPASCFVESRRGAVSRSMEAGRAAGCAAHSWVWDWPPRRTADRWLCGFWLGLWGGRRWRSCRVVCGDELPTTTPKVRL